MLVLGQEQGNTWLCDVNTANTRDAGRGILAKEVFQLLPCSSLWSEPFKFFRVFQLPRTVFSAIRKRGGFLLNHLEWNLLLSLVGSSTRALMFKEQPGAWCFIIPNV